MRTKLQLEQAIVQSVRQTLNAKDNTCRKISERLGEESPRVYKILRSLVRRRILKSYPTVIRTPPSSSTGCRYSWVDPQWRNEAHKP